MQVTIDKSAGFCWGVVRTIEIAEDELASLEEGNHLFSLGEIIHNPMEIKRIEQKGLKTISRDDLASVRGGKVLIRAHGEPPSTFQRAKEINIEIIDATCPVVRKVQERIKKFYDQGYQIVIYGKRDHAEVVGLVGQTQGEAIVIKSLDDIKTINFDRKTVLFSQTTMDKDTFYKIKMALQERIQDFVVSGFLDEAVEFHAKDTICGQVFSRDKKLQEYARQNDIMIFVAGRISSNGKVLYQICKEANPRTYFIENESELDDSWFDGVERVGISGATSTPHWLMERVKSSIDKRYTAKGAN